MKLDRVIAVRNNKTVYRDGDRCIKVFNAEYSKAKVLKEAFNQSLIEETGINVPKIIEVTMLDGKWAIVSEFIKGKTLAQYMEECPEKKEEYISFFTDLQMNIHSKTAPYLDKLIEKMSRQIAQTEIDATMRYALCSCLDNMPKDSKICHGDFNPSNIIIDNNEVPYILDWSRATQGNTSADVIRSYFLFMLNEDKTGADTYLDMICTKSNTNKKDFQKWIPIVAAADLVKCNEREREFLIKWVNTVRNK